VSELTLGMDAIRYVKELYPRLKPDDAAIERYRSVLDRLPPIVVARGGVLVDGFHRWQAHKREEQPTIQAVDLGDLSDVEIKKESWSRNADALALPFTTGDLKKAADEFYRLGMKDIAELAAFLRLTEQTTEKYVRDARRDEKQALMEQAWDLYLDCYSDREIAKLLGLGSNHTAKEYYEQFSNSFDFCSPPASRQHFDIWDFPQADEGGTESFHGRMPPQVVENLLWAFTEPGWRVFDPFAGGGTTIDVAKRMGRRVWAMPTANRLTTQRSGRRKRRN
jgi:hypothetical protein